VSRPRDRIAAIDVGSNTILLTIAEYDPDSGLVVVEEGEDQPRLGAGLSTTGRLGEDSMARAVESLTRMRDTCHRHHVTRLAAVATAAVREAENGAEFVERVRALEIPLRIISAQTEAALSYRSAIHHFPSGRRTMVADIGGGSVELTGAVNGAVQLSRSLPLGAVRLTELDLRLAKLRAHIRRALELAVPSAEWAESLLIGSGGTFTTIGAITLASRGWSSRSVHGTLVTKAGLEKLVEELAAMTPDQRRRVPGLPPQRADIIVAGVAVAAVLVELVGADGVTVSGFGLRDGLLLEMVGIV
jgi:exopolyphosphatase / guanosine-5'-triphosphate,3'-diphosphate pyrophosphatase